MSYSFSVSAANKAEALAKVSAEMAKVVQGQPVHAKDEGQARAAVAAFVGLLGEDGTKDVAISVSGWLSSYETGIQGASVTVSASLVERKKA